MRRPAGSAADRPGRPLPFIDEYTIEVQASPERVWDALACETLPRFGAGAGPLGPLGARLLGCPYTQAPRPGPSVPEEIVGLRGAPGAPRARRPPPFLALFAHLHDRAGRRSEPP